MDARYLRNLVFAAIIIVVMLSGSGVSLALPAAPASAAATGNVTLPNPLTQTNPAGNITLQKPPPKGNPKLDSTLSLLASQNGTPAIGPLTSGVSPQTPAGTVRVVIEAAAGQTNNVTAAAGALGTVEGKYGNLVQMTVPASKLTALAQLPNAKFVRLPMTPLPLETSQGVDVIHADDWQLPPASYNGTGVKIGILDVGFSGYPALIGTDLPASVTAQSFINGGNINGPAGNPQIHGTACAEIVYDIAPAATYYLANFATDVEYGNAVNWLISQNVTIISCSVGWPTGGPGNGTGFFCQVIDSAKAAGIFWAQAVGNSASRHWQGTWSNSDNDTWHNFSGDDEGNTISANAGYPIVVALKWNDPWYSSNNDYDLLLYNSSGSLVAYSNAPQDGDDSPIETLGYYATYTGTYDIKIEKYGSPAPVTFHLYSYYQDLQLQYQTAAGSFTVPADSFSAVAVGAVNYATPTALESFSSRGPTDDGRIIPALVAPDGVLTVSYPQLYGPGYPFTGTSAAAPHTAGAAALVKQRFPSYTPAQIQAFLEGRAVDLGAAGKDNLYGSGRLDLGNASDNFTLTMASNSNETVTSVTVYVRTLHNVSAVKACLKTYNTIYESVGLSNSSDWTTRSYLWNANPFTNLAWTWDEINNLEIGVALSGTNAGPDWSRCTQVYAEVVYTQNGLAQLITLRPTGDGTETSIDTISPSSPSTHYDKVDDVSPDENTTYIENKNGAPDTYQRDLFIIPDHSPSGSDGSGNVTPAAGTYSLASGTSVNITAIPAPGCQFTSWTGDVVNKYSADTTVIMDTDKVVIANFNQATSMLTMAVMGSGNVTPSIGNYSLPLSANATIYATPSPGWAFANWIGEVWSNNSSTTNVTMNTNKTVTANFTRISSFLKMTISGSGTVTPARGLYSYPVGTTVNITATPASGWRFDGWTGMVGNIASASTNVSMDTDKTITARFSQIPAPPPDLGGGIGGGGGATNDKRITGLVGVVNDAGRIGTEVQAQSLDSKLTLTLPVGTFAKNRNGAALGSITVTNSSGLKQPPAGQSIIGIIYDLGPQGATFSPAIPMTVQYSESDIPAGAAEAHLYLATWDESAGAWSRIDCQVDTTANKITAAVSHFSEYTILAPTGTATFTLSDIKVSPAQIKTGENAVVSVFVTNSSGLKGDFQIVLKVNDAVRETKTVTLEASANTTVSFNVVGGAAGTYKIDIGGLSTSFSVGGKPASFKVDSLSISPAETDIGQTASIQVVVTNTGETEGRYLLTLKINTREAEIKEITLAGGASQTVTFKAASDSPGKKIVEINGLIGGFIVKGEVPPPSQIPLPLEKPATTVTPQTVSPSPTSLATTPVVTQKPVAPSGSNTWIYGIFAGGMLIVAIGIVFLARQSKRTK